MHLRFNRSAAVRGAYQLYDDCRTDKVIKFCTQELAKPRADPELLILRGRNYSDRNQRAKAIADWEACVADPHLAGVAHYHLGNEFANHAVEGESTAWDHFTKAVERGWVEGNVGRGYILLTRACRLRDDENKPSEAENCFREAIEELTLGLTSPQCMTRNRAYGLRASVYYNLGDLEACTRDTQATQEATDFAMTDPRATGAELFQ